MPVFIPTDRQTAEEWRSESTQKPPKQAVYLPQCNAAGVLQRARLRTATVWTGDFHNAKQVLAAMKKRVCRPFAANAAQDAREAFHKHRMRQAQAAALLNMLAVEIGADFKLTLPRAPDVRGALADVYGEPGEQPFLLPLNLLLGFIGAHEWHKKGVYVPALGGSIHVPFGVFSPLRGEYLDLIARAPLPEPCARAFDIGTGSGVIAALLSKRGAAEVAATDTNPRAVACARANIERLVPHARIRVEETDLFPLGSADLIVCNPPWLPAKPTSAVETALYDPGHAMLKAFLNGARSRLNPNGEVWLVMSDLAEHLHLRDAGFLEQCFQTASLKTAGILQTAPAHGKAADARDPLAFARSRETTFLYRLKAA